ncbi:hypothetical protein MMC08_004009 [Hypocenomyce scalaris]|nr:hypothetical protein [Hypocenomyce scalaris]
MSGVWQTVAYIFRVLSITYPASFGDYAAWFVLILVAPLWTNAFVYMVLGRMVWNFTSKAKILGVTAWRFGLYFVLLDITAFVIQVYGAATATTGTNEPENKVLQGLHIYMIGVGVQQTFALLFLFFVINFHRTLFKERLTNETSRALPMLYAIYAVLTLITTRIIFRLCEYSKGLTSTIPNHEAYQYCLDSLPMLAALFLLNIIHPGRIMPGKDSNLPSRKERKRDKICTKSDRNGILPSIEPAVSVTSQEKGY